MTGKTVKCGSEWTTLLGVSSTSCLAANGLKGLYLGFHMFSGGTSVKNDYLL